MFEVREHRAAALLGAVDRRVRVRRDEQLLGQREARSVDREALLLRSRSRSAPRCPRAAARRSRSASRAARSSARCTARPARRRSRRATSAAFSALTSSARGPGSRRAARSCAPPAPPDDRGRGDVAAQLRGPHLCGLRGGRDRGLAADDLAHGLRVRLQALDLAAAARGERLAEVEQRLGAEDVAAADRDEDAEDGADDEAADRQPPASRDARPGRPQVDLALGVEIDARLSADVAHRAATLAATHSHWARSPSASVVVGPQPSSRSARVTSARVRRTSPAAAPWRSTTSGAPAICLRERDRLAHRRLVAAADVVDRSPAAALHRSDRPADRVGDVREAPRHGAVAEEAERPARRERLEHARERHVRPLPRAVDGEVADADGVEPGRAGVGVREVLDASFVTP